MMDSFLFGRLLVTVSSRAIQQKQVHRVQQNRGATFTPLQRAEFESSDLGECSGFRNEAVILVVDAWWHSGID
jgi:hypothetical protein